jgi:hypothetical protein
MPISMSDKVRECGYIFLPGYLPKESGTLVAQSLGELLSLSDGHAVHELTPRTKEFATPNTYSGIYGLQRFPFHTDLAHWRLPPHYLMLRCVAGFERVPTLLADGLSLAKEVGLAVLARALVQPRRPINGKLPLLRMYQPIHNDCCLIRWDEIFFRPASNAGATGMALFKKCVVACAPIRIALAAPGDTLVIDNWRMLHARSSIPIECNARKIERAYLENLT